MTEYLKK